MAEQQHQENVNEENVEGEEDQAEFIDVVAFPLLEPEEQTITLAELQPQDIDRIRRTDPFLYHSIKNELTGNNVCTFDRRGGDGGAAVGVADEFAGPRGIVAANLDVDNMLSGNILRRSYSRNQRTADVTFQSKLGSRSAPQLNRMNVGNTERNNGAVGGRPSTNVTQRSAPHGLRRSNSLPQINDNVRIANRVVTRRRRFSTEIALPDFESIPDYEVNRTNDTGDRRSVSLMDELLSSISSNFNDGNENGADRAAGH